MSFSTFSVDDIADSIWDYHTFLHDSDARRMSDPSSQAPPPPPHDYHAYLKSQLDRACAAVARSRVPATKPGESVALPETRTKSSKSPPQAESRDDGPARGASTVQCASDDSPIGIPALPPMLKNSAVQVKQITSESSREDSDDDELEGDTGTTGNEDPAEVKRVRRMESNRESARRSRRRKQEHMTELETQVGQLKMEHTTLLKRLTDVNQKCDEASVDNRILKADIETLRAKVKMAEETVKRVTGINPLLLAMSSMPNTSIPFMSSSLDSFSIPTMPVQPNPRHQSFNHPPTIDAMNSQPSRLVSNFHNHTNSNPLPPAVGNLQNREVNNAPQISNVPNIDGSVAMWGTDLPHSQSQKH